MELHWDHNILYSHKRKRGIDSMDKASLFSLCMLAAWLITLIALAYMSRALTHAHFPLHISKYPLLIPFLPGWSLARSWLGIWMMCCVM